MTDKTEAERLADELREEVAQRAMAPASLLNAAAAELRRLSEEVEALRTEAGRYRWLADCNNYYEALYLIANPKLTEAALSEAIDAAMNNNN